MVRALKLLRDSSFQSSWTNLALGLNNLKFSYQVDLQRMHIRDLTQQGRHRRGQRLRQCDSIDCITVFQSEFGKSFLFLSALVEFTRSLHFFATWDSLFWRFLVNVRACGRVLVSDKFIQCITLIMMLVVSLCWMIMKVKLKFTPKEASNNS